jgi:hypothetical protein
MVSGCILHTYRLSADCRGVVRDAQSLAPLTGVQVAFSADPRRVVRTGSDGQFHLRAHHALQMTIPGPCPINLLQERRRLDLLVVTHAGFQEKIIDLRKAQTGIIQVLMEPSRSPQSP